MLLQEAISKRIIELCDERNITLSGLATQATISHVSVINLCNGKTKALEIPTLSKMLTALDIGPTEFFTSPLFANIDPEVK